jgi:hypothetical protein
MELNNENKGEIVMSVAGYIIMGVMALAFIILMVFLIKRRMKDIKIEDANIPGQIQEIIKMVVSEGVGYKAVPIMSTQSTADMLKDTLKDKALSGLTGHRIYTYRANEKFVLVYGNQEMFFVPIFDEFHTKQITPDLTKITRVDVGDLIKVKTNRSGSSVTLIYNKKVKFLFVTLSEFFFYKASAKTEKEEFGGFIQNFANEVNNK